MTDPASTTGPMGAITVVGANEQSELDGLDVERWEHLASGVLAELVNTPAGTVDELTLTFVDRDEIAALNESHMSVSGPTDVLSFPLDAGDDLDASGVGDGMRLLGDVVICPAVAAQQAPTHAGTLDDELALLVVHGILHVLGRDHADASTSADMRAEELRLLSTHHWQGPPPAAFRQEHA